jgi:hypothetical protein
MVILVFFFIQIQSPFIGKLLIIGVIIYTLAYIQFLKQRIHLISITVSSVERLRSYKILRDRIIKIVEKEFQKSLSFLLYRNYRIFVTFVIIVIIVVIVVEYFTRSKRTCRARSAYKSIKATN